MKIVLHYLILPLLSISLISCGDGGKTRFKDTPDKAVVLLEQANRDISNQHFEEAMEKALSALSLSQGAGDALGEVRALSTIVGIDIMASRDADAWEKALQAEPIAREYGFKKELADILISKSKLCSYAEISPETGRNDEGLDYAKEALALAEDVGIPEQQAEACYVIGDVKDKDVIIVDDICDTGGSLLAATEILKDNGARDVYVCVTHGLFSNDAAARIQNSQIKEIVVTNTIVVSKEELDKTSKITVLSVGWMLSKLILAVSCHTPVSEVYALYE